MLMDIDSSDERRIHQSQIDRTSRAVHPEHVFGISSEWLLGAARLTRAGASNRDRELQRCDEHDEESPQRP
jgi:hypothetical protein